ncbi:MAG: TetR/AcrR family transcriptional regulator [Deltaproteobacteria bacterium]|nr:TetR/AcrR family transcriptional regulator [Deltaproteobacteria bacterium]NND28900.1 TetR/AcrR family transcriptional regulator [Myxococcales bacterium]MBT8464085.1 TetR/AcrR family transcriptional regulator [Deltaproteobacteria bacterium]MBT8483319.1 TetR/AcrR family transcriptional regulator [Deltaproteobacteria bacterium]NNK05946.1 TetR/AcrR family transcriptional regulator [Myxococcales bacterium]
MSSGRKSYHHGRLRETLVETAFRLVDSEGVEALSMRALAREAGVSSAAPFRHFADKQLLLQAVAEKASTELQRKLDDASDDRQDALTQFRAMTVAYVRFAAEHPKLFQLLQQTPSVSGAFLGELNDERRLKLIALIYEGQNAGLIPDADPELIALSSEALTHGLARMIVDRHPRVRDLSSEDARKLALAATQLLQSGIGLS